MIGPHANATMALIQHDSGAVCADGANENWSKGGGESESSFHCVVSPFGAVREINDAVAGGTTTYTSGCDLYAPSSDNFAAGKNTRTKNTILYCPLRFDILLLTSHCSLLTAHCSLPTAHCSLLTAQL